MDATRTGKDYIAIHKTKLTKNTDYYDSSTPAIEAEFWHKIAVSLADDLALVVTRLDDTNKVVTAISLENLALKDEDSQCNRDNCGYINEYKSKLDEKSQQLDDALRKVITHSHHISGLQKQLMDRNSELIAALKENISLKEQQLMYDRFDPCKSCNKQLNEICKELEAEISQETS